MFVSSRAYLRQSHFPSKTITAPRSKLLRFTVSLRTKSKPSVSFSQHSACMFVVSQRVHKARAARTNPEKRHPSEAGQRQREDLPRPCLPRAPKPTASLHRRKVRSQPPSAFLFPRHSRRRERSKQIQKRTRARKNSAPLLFSQARGFQTVAA